MNTPEGKIVCDEMHFNLAIREPLVSGCYESVSKTMFAFPPAPTIAVWSALQAIEI